jgi:N-acetylglutamate synthase-like GNAT family acetyltransferase
MEESVLKITGLTPQLEMEITELLDEAAVKSRCTGNADLFAIFDSDGRALGFACAERRGENCLIRFVVVRSDARMKGTGSALVNHVLGYFSGRCDRAYAAVGEAGGFFERFGFRYVPVEQLPEAVTMANLVEDADARTAGDERAAVMMIDLPSRWTIP